MIGGTAVQTLILAYLTVRCDWDEEVETSSSLLLLVFLVLKWTSTFPFFSSYKFVPWRSELIACVFVGAENQYTNASMGQLKMKQLHNIGAVS